MNEYTIHSRKMVSPNTNGKPKQDTEQTPLTFAQNTWKKVIRFVINSLGLLILRAILGALPMLKNASAFGDSLMSPLVLAYAIVDTVLLLVVLDFGITLARDIQNKYEHIPELKKLISLATIVLVLLFAYKVYTLPTACLVVQPTDLINLSHSGTPTAFGDFIRTWSQTLSQMNATAMQNAGGDALASYQQLAVAVLQRPPSIYGWTFLTLIALPTVGIVTLISRNLETFSELLSHTGAALVTTARPSGTPAGANVRSEGQRGAAAGESMSTREVMEKLTRLKSLWDSGIISKDDFENQKTRVLGRPISNSKPAESDDFQKLKSLLDSGALNEEEYRAYKEHLLELI
jgi:hypothetical protein